MTNQSAMHKRIRFWHTKSDAELEEQTKFEEQTKKEAELPSGGIPQNILEPDS